MAFRYMEEKPNSFNRKTIIQLLLPKKKILSLSGNRMITFLFIEIPKYLDDTD